MQSLSFEWFRFCATYFLYGLAVRVSSFFEGKPLEVLLGEGVDASQLNDSVLGRALDDLHAYGCTALFSQLTPLICERLALTPRFVHMDSTDFHLDGQYNAEHPPEEDSQLLHLTKGYSRDHRPDLNQVVLTLIADNQAGIPLHMEALDGNSSDKTARRPPALERRLLPMWGSYKPLPALLTW